MRNEIAQPDQICAELIDIGGRFSGNLPPIIVSGGEFRVIAPPLAISGGEFGVNAPPLGDSGGALKASGGQLAIFIKNAFRFSEQKA